MIEKSNAPVLHENTGLADRSAGVLSGRRRQKDAAAETQSRETRFQDVLKQVTGRDQEHDRDIRRSVSTEKDIRDRMSSIEKKLEKLSASESHADRSQLQAVRETLEAVRQYLERAGGAEKGPVTARIEFGNTGMDFSFFLNNLLGMVEDLMNRGKMSELGTLLGYINQKLDETGALLDALTGVPSKTNGQERTADGSPGKVKIVDLRGPGEFDPESGANSGLKTSGIRNEKTDAADSAKPAAGNQELPDSANLKKIGEQTPEAGRVRDLANTLSLFNKAESFQQSMRTQSAGMAATVSRSQLDALFQNIAGRMSMTLRDGSSEFKMSLTPPELGFMRMKFTLEDGQLAGKIVVSTPEAKALFDQNQGELQRALQQAGITLGQMDVAYSQDGSGSDTAGTADSSIVGSLFLGESMDAIPTDDGEPARHFLYDSRINFIA